LKYHQKYGARAIQRLGESRKVLIISSSLDSLLVDRFQVTFLITGDNFPALEKTYRFEWTTKVEDAILREID
jgi:hypothetical protein